MKKLVLLFAALLLVSVVGCSSGDSITGPDSSDQAQIDPAQKPPTPGDPDNVHDGPKEPRDPT